MKKERSTNIVALKNGDNTEADYNQTHWKETSKHNSYCKKYDDCLFNIVKHISKIQ